MRPLRERKPPWFKVPAPGGERYRELTELIRSENLHTVCQEAACPNVGECWERGTATFMILGDTCTRRCGFCNVKTGKPTWNDPLEPARVARSIARMGLRHAVITSVDRDDLPDKGASAFVGVIRQVRRQAPDCQIEVLTPDFQGQEMPLAKVIAERPDVFNHNVEVVPRLYPVARRGSRVRCAPAACCASPASSAKGRSSQSPGLMVGLGETHEEMVETFGALREHGVQVLTVGQYLRPSERHLAGRPLLAPRRVQGARAGRLRARLRPRRRRAPRALLLPRRPARAPAARRRRAAAPPPPAPRLDRAARPAASSARRPLVTLGLIAANAIAYLLSIRNGGSIIDGPTRDDRRLRRDPLRVRSPRLATARLRRCRLLTDRPVQRPGRRDRHRGLPSRATWADRLSAPCSCTRTLLSDRADTAVFLAVLGATLEDTLGRLRVPRLLPARRDRSACPDRGGLRPPR